MTTPDGSTSTGTFTILHVDDAQENIELLTEFFSDYGYLIISANNGIEALELLGKEDVHLIISDAMMPKMDGFQFCREIKNSSKYAHVPFFIYTGDYLDQEDRELAKSIGVDKYIHKGDGFNDLTEAVIEVASRWYGYTQRSLSNDKDVIDDNAFLEKHHRVIIKKLEEKMRDLEQYAETLNKKNLELQESEARYRSLFENANIGIIILDRETKRILDVNKQAVKLFKYEKEELLALGSLPIEEDRQMTAQLLYTEQFFSGDASIKNKDGQSIEVKINSVPIAHANDPRIIVYIRDISEQAKIQQKLLQIENMTLMGKLAAGIAHEIRNPLAAVTVNLQYLLKRFSDNEEMRSTVEMAMEGSKRAEQVIEKTLNLARAKPPQTKLENVNDIIEQVLWFMRIPMKQKNISVEKKLSGELPHISVDEKQIQQVLLNVLQNAVDVSEKNSLIGIHTYQFKKDDIKKVCIEIVDNGPGISDELQKNLFEPFNTTKKGGTGLGLAISKYIMDRHNANIQVSSHPGKGTSICLQFPVYQTLTGEKK